MFTYPRGVSPADFPEPVNGCQFPRKSGVGEQPSALTC